MDLINYIFSIYFSADSWAQSFLQGVIFIIAAYGFLSFLLFVIRYYIIYKLAKKLAGLLKFKLKDQKPEDPKPTDREDERLRDEEKEREAERVEKAEVQKIEKGQVEIEQEFKIMLPKATGKWQKLVLGNRQNLILAVAQRMQANKTMNFWQTMVEIQKEQRSMERGQNKGF